LKIQKNTVYVSTFLTVYNVENPRLNSNQTCISL